MEQHGGEDISLEQTDEVQTLTALVGAPELAAADVLEPPEAAVAPPVKDETRDHGDWKYRPWGKRDHWVNSRTSETTFDLKQVK